MSLHQRLGPGREFDRIRTLAERWKDRARAIGDDCAFVEAGGATLAISVDMSVENVHFRREWMTAQEIGYRAAAAALSDLAAVAAVPRALLWSCAIPRSEPDETLFALGDGVAAAAAEAGAVIVGGDLSAGTTITMDFCVIGAADAPVRRSGARAGDRLVVTGQLGGPLAALEAWRGGERPDPAALERFLRPAPRHEAARFLASLGARAMIDVSDGLASDLSHLVAASGAGARINVAAIPVHPAARSPAARSGEAAWRFAARSGEEYELIAALPASVDPEALARGPVPVTEIGTVEAEAGIRAFDGTAEVTLPVGHDHFREDE